MTIDRSSVVERVSKAFPRAYAHWERIVREVEKAGISAPVTEVHVGCLSLEARHNGWTLNASMLLDKKEYLAVGIDVYSGTRGEHHSAVQFVKNAPSDDLEDNWSVTMNLEDATHSVIIPSALVGQMEDRFNRGPNRLEEITELLSGRPNKEREINVSDDEAWQIIDALIRLYQLAPTSIVGSH